MKKPEKKVFEYTGKKCPYFTKSESYTAYRTAPGRWSIHFDDEEDPHGMSDHQISKWFKEVA